MEVVLQNKLEESGRKGRYIRETGTADYTIRKENSCTNRVGRDINALELA